MEPAEHPLRNRNILPGARNSQQQGAACFRAVSARRLAAVCRMATLACVAICAPVSLGSPGVREGARGLAHLREAARDAHSCRLRKGPSEPRGGLWL